MPTSRRQFLETLTLAGAAAFLPTLSRGADDAAGSSKGAGIAFGLVTYQWGKDWDLPTLLQNCSQAGVKGVELRTTHKHGVEPSLTDAERTAVRRQFEAGDVQCVGIGSNEKFDSPDPAVLQQALAAAKQFVTLSHDIGGSGVKVKPDSFHKEVPREQTIAQIGRSLNELAEFAEGFGQQIRLEVHGQCAELPTIKAILDVATHPGVAVCWNSNPQDLQGAGLAANFALVRDRLGATTHIHLLDSKTYPHRELLDLYVGIDYAGWWLLEEGTVPADPAKELLVQRELFDTLLADARSRAK